MNAPDPRRFFDLMIVDVVLDVGDFLLFLRDWEQRHGRRWA